MTPDQPTGTEGVVIEAYILDHRIVRVQCPQCRLENEFSMAELPPDQLRFKSECPCGAKFGVQLVGFRKGNRKRVKLAGTWTRLSHTSRIKSMCDVLDMSVTGMRFRTEFTKGLAIGDEVIIAIVLDDKNRTRLELAATVKRFVPATGYVGHLELGVEFNQPLDPHQHHALQSYLTF